ncbi:helix-turn-helix domain-containing protein [Maribellus mangrovi]|uniref:helix-turn-helix domain-containing protein n=1 Tax=Maribellus mangrovi TaxID=3133146 RepID=UPI0030EBBAB9
MKDRIQEYMDYKSINAGELAHSLEVQRSNISHILNGRNKPSAAFIEKMLNVYPDLNARWLLTGQGSMLEGSQSGNKELNVQIPSTTEKAPKQTKDIPQEIKQSQTDLESSKKNVKDTKYTDEDVNKVVLLFNDGTFTTYRKK